MLSHVHATPAGFSTETRISGISDFLSLARPCIQPAKRIARPGSERLQRGKPRGLTCGALLAPEVRHGLLRGTAVQPDAKLLWGQQRARRRGLCPPLGRAARPTRRTSEVENATRRPGLYRTGGSLGGGQLPAGHAHKILTSSAWTLAIRSLKAGRQLSLTTASACSPVRPWILGVEPALSTISFPLRKCWNSAS